jgi:glycosyltransferase involved in cell wall biosynthesis
MEKLKYSILVCAYSNGWQFSNFLYTVCNQDYQGNYEIIVVDNNSPTDEIYNICMKYNCRLSKIRYFSISKEKKKCRNIAQGINKAAEMSAGEYLVIVADSNVLLSFNLLSEIDKDELKDHRINISGKGTDIKISPNGKFEKEYESRPQHEIAIECSDILDDMGWPNDPMNLKLIDGKHRYPPPHNNFDVYIVGMNKVLFFEGPYNENAVSWGDYHSDFVKAKCKRYGHRRIENIRIIHQWHRVWKDADATA